MKLWILLLLLIIPVFAHAERLSGDRIEIRYSVYSTMSECENLIFWAEKQDWDCEVSDLSKSKILKDDKCVVRCWKWESIPEKKEEK